MSILTRTLRHARIHLDPRLRTVKAAAATSLCSQRRLLGLRRLAQTTAAKRLGGVFVECGTFRGGTALVISERLLAADARTPIYLFDVFSGMPRPGSNDPSAAWADVGKFVSSPEIVRETFRGAGVPIETLHIAPGLYERTLPGFEFAGEEGRSGIAFLHLDCDWHDSVMLALRSFYDRVLPGGAIVIDDYGHWSGCRKAVDTFLSERGIRITLVPIDYTSHYFMKP